MRTIIDTSQLTEHPSWPESRLDEVVRFALRQMDVPDDCEVSVTLVDTSSIHELNARFRGVDRPTDVLSFPCDDPWAQDAGADGTIVLGDIVIAPAVAAAQASGFGNTFDEEMAMLAIHSVLHLLGYDHIEEADAARMQAEERRIVTAWRTHEGLAAKADVLGYEHPADRPDGASFDREDKEHHGK